MDQNNIQVIVRDREYNVPHTETFSISVATGANSVNLSNLQSLKGKFIIGAFVRSNANGGVSYMGNPLPPPGDLAAGFLTLVRDGGASQSINTPLSHLATPAGEYWQLLLKGLDYTKSSVYFPNGATVDFDFEITFIVVDAACYTCTCAN